MAFYESYDPHARYKPLTTVGGYQLYLTQILILVHVVGTIFTALSSGLAGNVYAAALSLNTWDVMNGAVWQMATYAYVDSPGLWLIFVMLMFFFTFGPEVEKYIGRQSTVILYVSLILVPSFTFLGMSAILGQPLVLGGCTNLIAGFFIAYATLYPGIVFNFFFFQLSLKWMALIFLGVYSLIYIGSGSFIGLIAFLLCPGTAFLYLKYLGVQGGFGKVSEWMESKRLERAAKKQKLKVVREKQRERSIDEILDKISKQGIGSLTPEERKTLERARSDLMERDGRE